MKNKRTYTFKEILQECLDKDLNLKENSTMMNVVCY
jgi:hypothetical protein